MLKGFDLELLLANAHHMKNLPGRKTDMKDAEWLAKLLRSGLVDASFVPHQETRELRDLTRYRKKLVQEATAEKNRIYRLLQDANINSPPTCPTFFGVSGRRLLEQIINGEVITEEFLQAEMRGALRRKSTELLLALEGRLHRHHRDMIRLSYEHIQFIEQMILEVEQEIERHLADRQEAVELLTTIPGINMNAAAIILAEIGTDIEQFGSDSQLAAWAGLSPGNHESAGKKKKVSSRSGNKALRTVLVECAWAAARSRQTRLSSRYWLWVRRMGIKKALVALAHTMLRIVYHVLHRRQPYEELGADYLERFRKDSEQGREADMIRKLAAKGYMISQPTI
ncbi:IS110 family transposase [Sulfoacidibacillus thermotolerans]|uniref:IS110 family transposase n=1 Tax=Sulfoacidibacillus thermotolerans TaxID=1765684 RepID=UPI001FE5E2F1|nr:IS110 family transposase [Sulfoacidibacillus thermotolerans]